MNSSYTPLQTAVINNRTAFIKREILSSLVLQEPIDGHTKQVPITLADFSEMHDYCDANCLGEFCEDGLHDRISSLFDGNPVECLGAVQNKVDDWIQNGDMLATVVFLARHDEEGRECLLEASHREDRYGYVVDEMGGRMNHLFPPETIRLLTQLCDSDEDYALVRPIIEGPQHVVAPITTETSLYRSTRTGDGGHVYSSVIIQQPNAVVTLEVRTEEDAVSLIQCILMSCPGAKQVPAA